MKQRLIAALILASFVFVGALLSAQRTATEHWVGTWATAGVAAPVQGAQGQPGRGGGRPAFKDQTLRQVVHTSIGGPRVRVVLTNAFGTRPLPVGGAHVSLREKGGAIVAGSDRPLTFGGAPTTT